MTDEAADHNDAASGHPADPVAPATPVAPVEGAGSGTAEAQDSTTVDTGVTGQDSVPKPTVAVSAAARRKKRIKSAVEWIAVIAVALVVALGIRQFLLQPFWIPSGSMEDTLDIGDRVLVNKAAYHFHGIRRGDVVVFEQPKSWPLSPDVKDLIKRVIAISGDEVEIHDCSVWLNGDKLAEPYTDGKCTEPATEVLDPDGDGKFTVPTDMLFVMGDNRTGSTDSRFNGFVPKGDVLGRAFVVIWPRSHWRWL